jgi:small subunit ribosomal protein S17
MKIFEGKVISTGMNNTVVVEVFRITPHPLYKKLVRLSKKFKVDNTGFENVVVGSVVKIQETKPVSKFKYFKISELVKAGEGMPVEEKKVEKVKKLETVSVRQAQEATLKAETSVQKGQDKKVKTAVKKPVKKITKTKKETK